VKLGLTGERPFDELELSPPPGDDPTNTPTGRFSPWLSNSLSPIAERYADPPLWRGHLERARCKIRVP
jgi:hypothetical protein